MGTAVLCECRHTVNRPPVHIFSRSRVRLCCRGLGHSYHAFSIDQLTIDYYSIVCVVEAGYGSSHSLHGMGHPSLTL